MTAWDINIPGFIFVAIIAYGLGIRRGLREKREAKAKTIDLQTEGRVM